MGRNPGEEPRKYQIQQLWDTQHEILRRLVLGQKSVEIARDLQISPAAVSYVKNSEVGKRQLSLMRSAADVQVIDIAGRIKQLAATAVQVMEAALDDGQPIGLRMKAAVDILDRAGHAAPKVLRTENLHAHLTADDIADIKQRAKENGVVINAVVEEIA